MNLLRYVVPFVAVTMLHILLQAVLSPLGRPNAVMAAGLITFLVTVACVVMLRRLRGRESLDAYRLLSAAIIPIVLGGIAADELLTGGKNFLLTLLVVVTPAILLSTLVERLLYTAEERKRLRAQLSGREPEGGGSAGPPKA